MIQKMRRQDYVILCVEDTTDWKHATTRNVVTQVRRSSPFAVLLCSTLMVVLPASLVAC